MFERFKKKEAPAVQPSILQDMTQEVVGKEYKIVKSSWIKDGIDLIAKDGSLFTSLAIGETVVLLATKTKDTLIYKSRPISEIRTLDDLRETVDKFIHLPATSDEVIDISRKALAEKMEGYKGRTMETPHLFDVSRQRKL